VHGRCLTLLFVLYRTIHSWCDVVRKKSFLRTAALPSSSAGLRRHFIFTMSVTLQSHRPTANNRQDSSIRSANINQLVVPAVTLSTYRPIRSSRAFLFWPSSLEHPPITSQKLITSAWCLGDTMGNVACSLLNPAMLLRNRDCVTAAIYKLLLLFFRPLAQS